LRDLFDLPISVGQFITTVAAEQAAVINQSQNLSAIEGYTMRFYQSNLCCGSDARSTYCYLLAAARDENTWASTGDDGAMNPELQLLMLKD